MNENEKKFINSVPESDPDHAVKRFQIKEWYEPFGKKILMSADLSYVAEKLNNFSDAKYWMHRQFGDFILNRASIVNELLGIKRIDDEDLLDDYDRYQVVCWLCSEESIRKNFPSLKQYQGDSESEGEFVTDTLGRYSRLMEFWSHYIRIMDKNGDLISNPNEKILNNFKELIAKYNKNYHKNLDYNTQVDLWKYGFECAKKEGCIEALEFFLGKLEGRITQNERDGILIDTALYATSSGSFNLRHSNANVIDFCLANLGADKYKMLLQKDFEVRGNYSILDELEGRYLFWYVKELIGCLEPENISFEKYSVHLISGIGRQVCVAPDKKLMQVRGDFLTWILDKEGFAKHREYCLNKLSKGDPGLINMLSELSKAVAFEPLEKILDSVTKAGRKEIAESFRMLQEPCCALYIQGRKDLLDKVLDDTKYSNNFVRAIEEILKQNPAYKQKWDCACNLHKEFRIKESMTKILELLSDCGLSDIIDKKINEFEQASQAGGDVSSSLNDLKSTASIQADVSKYRTH
ncbi:hypothetical protein [Wolbachia endosymbiont (group A) of Ennomos erosarius]|uniref:hypothetical protein n=1 Tax=Wolbachia endosymbiont (group A) of Ennomos erosarius TaxID=3066174 RepID=UPI00333E3589